MAAIDLASIVSEATKGQDSTSAANVQVAAGASAKTKSGSGKERGDI